LAIDLEKNEARNDTVLAKASSTLKDRKKHKYPLVDVGSNTSTVALRVVDMTKWEQIAWNYNCSTLLLGL
jgi:hypothetical protein